MKKLQSSKVGNFFETQCSVLGTSQAWRRCATYIHILDCI